MGRRTIGLCLAVGLVAIIAAIAVPVANATNKGPTSVTLDYNGKKKHVANFPHHDHQAHNDCATCHHKWDKAGDPNPCKHCHSAKKGDGPSIKDAYHKKCKGCHKKEKKGPTKCKGCHGRK